MKADLILGFDCSAAHCAAVLLSDSMVVTRVEMMAKGQAERLVPMLDEMLVAEGVVWADLTAIAVGVGPGNFTGIRIAVALARGLALGLQIPAIGVTGFEALAHGTGLPVTVALEAPRGQVYIQSITRDGPGKADMVEAAPDGARRVADLDLAGFIAAIGFVAGGKASTPQPRPAPFYLRHADAAPASDPPPVILP